MKGKIKEKIPKIIPYVIILIAVIAICIPLLRKDLNMYRDDGIQHICRLMGTYQSISQGQFFSVIMTNFCNGFGYSWNLFYSPITAYLPLILKIFQISYTSCIKIFMFIVVYASGITMFKFTQKVTKNNNIAMLAAIFYILAPYRITDMYVRNALAELTSFVFIPMVFNGLYTLLNNENKNCQLAIGAICLILTHTIVTMYTAILCFIYLLVNIKKLKNRKILKNIAINLFFIIAISSFFWVPLLEHKIASSYEVFVPGRMERQSVLESYKANPAQLIYTPKNQNFIYEIGAANIIGIVLILLAYNKIPSEYKKETITFLIMGLCLTFITLNFFPFEKLPAILKMIQFTFRLYEFTSFFFAFVAAVNYGNLLKNFKITDVLIFLIISILLLVPYKDKIEYKNNNENALWPAVQLTKNTGRVHAGMASFEYLPSKAFNNKAYIISRKDEPIIIKGDALIQSFSKNGTNMEIQITNIKENTTIELPYIYYLGYQIKCTTAKNNTTEKLQYTESSNGFIQIELKNMQECKIQLQYTGSTAMKISLAISILALIAMIIFMNLHLLYFKRYSKI